MNLNNKTFGGKGIILPILKKQEKNKLFKVSEYTY